MKFKQALRITIALLLTVAAPTLAAPEDPPPLRARIEVQFGAEQGVLEVELYPKLAPITVANFAWHAQQGTYKDSSFHRVRRGFMIQGGQPADAKKIFEPIPGEFGALKHERGVLSMARTEDPNSARSEFFIMHQAKTTLDKVGYAAFGKVLQGMEIVDRIAAVEVQPNPNMGNEKSQPVVPVRIVNVTLDRLVDVEALRAYAARPKGLLVLSLAPQQELYRAGGPVRVQLLMENGGAATLYRKDLPALSQGLLLVDNETGKAYEPKVTDPRVTKRKPERLAPGAFYGRTVDLAQWFPDALPQEGSYTLTWNRGAAVAKPAQLIVHNDQLFTITTDGGSFDIEFDTDEAPLGSFLLMDMLVKGAFNGALVQRPQSEPPWKWVDVVVPRDRIPQKFRATEARNIRFEEGSVIFAPTQPLRDPEKGEPVPGAYGLRGTHGHFRIVTASWRDLDGRHAKVGRVIRGIELLKGIGTDEGVKPIPNKKAAPPDNLHALRIQSASWKPHTDRKPVQRSKVPGSLHAKLTSVKDAVVYGEPIYTRLGIGNDSDWHVRTKGLLSLQDGLRLVDFDQKEYPPNLRAPDVEPSQNQPILTAMDLELPQPDPVVLTGEFFGITLDLDLLFPQFESGGDFALQWKRNGKQRALAGTTVQIIHYARVVVSAEDGEETEFILELFHKETPRTVEAFEKLARENFYKGTIFHHALRSRDLQLLQAGGLEDDPLHIADIDPIPFEPGPHRFNEPGIVGLAHRLGRRDEGTSQFFICLDAAPELSNRYTSFAKVIHGMEQVGRIQEGVKIQRIEPFLRKLVRKEGPPQ